MKMKFAICTTIFAIIAILVNTALTMGTTIKNDAINIVKEVER